MTIYEKNIDFARYEKFLNLIRDQAIKELKEVIDNQKIIYLKTVTRILKAKGTVSRKIRIVKKLKIKFHVVFSNIINEYLNVICLFALKQTAKEIKVRNPKRLSSEINSWIKASVYTIVLKYLNEVNFVVTFPIIDNIGRGLSDKEILFRISLIFDEIKKVKPYSIISSMEGKALFRGRDLAVKLFNGDLKLETGGFAAQTVEDVLKRERVVAAQWSAILDTHVCELCASLDGKIIDIDSPDYAFYNPGSIHLKCRCLWIYIKSTERPENRMVDWQPPKKSLLKKYASVDNQDVGLASIQDRWIKADELLSKEDSEQVQDKVENQLSTLSKMSTDTKKFMKGVVANPRFDKYIVKGEYIKGITNIKRVGEDALGRGVMASYSHVFKEIKLGSMATSKSVSHEIAHHITGQEKYGFQKYGVASEKVANAYHNAVKNYASKLSETPLATKQLKEHLSFWSVQKEGRIIRFREDHTYYRDIVKATNRGGVVSTYSLKNPSEYIAEGVSHYIENPNALRMRDPGLFNLIGEFFREGKI